MLSFSLVWTFQIKFSFLRENTLIKVGGGRNAAFEINCDALHPCLTCSLWCHLKDKNANGNSAKRDFIWREMWLKGLLDWDLTWILALSWCPGNVFAPWLNVEKLSVRAGVGRLSIVVTLSLRYGLHTSQHRERKSLWNWQHQSCAHGSHWPSNFSISILWAGKS